MYYQSLTLLFLPCEHFTKNDAQNQMYVDACEKENRAFASVKITLGERRTECEGVCGAGDKRKIKNLIGRTVIGAFMKLFGVKPPWGICTGVKPLKLAQPYVGVLGEQAASRILENEYLIDSRRVRLCMQAIKRGQAALSGMTENACSLYVSIPFCPTRCNYCSFVSCITPRLMSLIPEYLERLKEDLKRISEVMRAQNLSLKSVYVGGGTPAVLDEAQTEFLLCALKDSFDGLETTEFTFEAGRPDCITPEKLKILKEHGVGRISVNTQSTNDEVLKLVGRNHTYRQFLEAFESARSIGFECINTDLIAGLPSESTESFCKSVDEVCALAPENITVHSFALKKSSDFKTQGQTDIAPSFYKAAKMIDYAADKLSDGGYGPYYLYRQKNTVGNLENTGYAKSGFESVYNIAMMDERHTVFAAGAGAVTKLVSKDGKVKRIFAPKYPYEYLDREKYAGFDMQAAADFYTNEKGEN